MNDDGVPLWGGSYSLAPHVHACQTEDGLVLLDLRREKYFSLANDQLIVLRGMVQGLRRDTEGDGSEGVDAKGSAAGIADELVSAGLFVRGRSSTQGMSSVPPAVDHAIPYADVVSRAAGLLDVGRFIAAHAAVTVLLRLCCLESLVARATRRRMRERTMPMPDPREVQRLASIFCRLRPLAASSRNGCLPDSFAMIEFLAYYGVFPLWVFGVTTRPFFAHCWVQHETWVLNDSVEHVRAFTPILVA